MGDKAQNCKVVLLGESGVGKTCIISRYVNNTYDEKSETTNGASYASKTLDFDSYNKSLRFDIWDTAGQEKYRSLTRFFYKDAAIAILVYDITRRDSFEELKTADNATQAQMVMYSKLFKINFTKMDPYEFKTFTDILQHYSDLCKPVKGNGRGKKKKA